MVLGLGFGVAIPWGRRGRSSAGDILCPRPLWLRASNGQDARLAGKSFPLSLAVADHSGVLVVAPRGTAHTTDRRRGPQ